MSERSWRDLAVAQILAHPIGRALRRIAVAAAAGLFVQAVKRTAER